MSDEEDDLPEFIRNLLSHPLSETEGKKQKLERQAANRQAYAATHGERQTCRAAIDCALDYLAHDLARYFAKMCGNQFQAVDVFRDIKSLIDKVRGSIDEDLLREDGQIDKSVFVELRSWRDSR